MILIPYIISFFTVIEYVFGIIEPIGNFGLYHNLNNYISMCEEKRTNVEIFFDVIINDTYTKINDVNLDNMKNILFFFSIFHLILNIIKYVFIIIYSFRKYFKNEYLYYQYVHLMFYPILIMQICILYTISSNIRYYFQQDLNFYDYVSIINLITNSYLLIVIFMIRYKRTNILIMEEIIDVDRNVSINVDETNSQIRYVNIDDERFLYKDYCGCTSKIATKINDYIPKISIIYLIVTILPLTIYYIFATSRCKNEHLYLQFFNSLDNNECFTFTSFTNQHYGCCGNLCFEYTPTLSIIFNIQLCDFDIRTCNSHNPFYDLNDILFT
jgi:hypothetical protein